MIQGLSVQGLRAERGGRLLFEDLSFELVAGEALEVAGPNGAGKTTLLRILAGLSPSAGGAIAFHGAAGPLEADDARASGLHLLGHKDGLRSTRRSGEELDFWSNFCGGDAQGRSAATAAFRLKDLLALNVAALSAGQRRRLALARLLAAPRRLWLLDEPLAPLDRAARAGFATVMDAHLQEGGLIIAATHDPLPVTGRRLEIHSP